MIFLGLVITAAGTFVFLWYRTVVGLSLKRQPQFIRPVAFKWGVPAVALTLFTAGILLLVSVSTAVALGTVVVSAVLCGLVIRFDRYSAYMRLIHDHYLRTREANPDLEEAEILFHTARWRYPEWSQDRVVELVAGKDIEALTLLMIVSENDINPIRDWELYRSLKTKAKQIIRSGE